MNAIDDIDFHGLTGWTGWGAFFLLGVTWIKGRADRMRASTEGNVALFAAYEARLLALQGEIAQMRVEHEREREQWRKERRELLSLIDGLQRQDVGRHVSAGHLLDRNEVGPLADILRSAFPMIDDPNGPPPNDPDSGGTTPPPSPTPKPKPPKG